MTSWADRVVLSEPLTRPGRSLWVLLKKRAAVCGAGRWVQGCFLLIIWQQLDRCQPRPLKGERGPARGGEGGDTFIQPGIFLLLTGAAGEDMGLNLKATYLCNHLRHIVKIGQQRGIKSSQTWGIFCTLDYNPVGWFRLVPAGFPCACMSLLHVMWQSVKKKKLECDFMCECFQRKRRRHNVGQAGHQWVSILSSGGAWSQMGEPQGPAMGPHLSIQIMIRSTPPSSTTT